MGPELSYLVASALLFSLMIVAEAVIGNMQYSLKTLLGSRDDLPPHGAALARAKRATQNTVEAMVMFTPLVLVAVLTQRTNEITALGAAIFFFARLAYAPTYWFGISGLRTLVWFAGLIGTLMVASQVLPFIGAV